MRLYDLKWLFAATTADGQVWQQTAQDRSARFPEIELVSLFADQVITTVYPGDPAYADYLAQIDAGARTLPYNGEPVDWRTRSAFTDLADYVERGEVTQFSLSPVDHPQHRVEVILQGERAGDIEWHCPGTTHPVTIPFALPEPLWKKSQQPGLTGIARPAVKLVYWRDVTVQGMSWDDAVATDLVYRVGWRTELLGEQFSHTVELRQVLP